MKRLLTLGMVAVLSVTAIGKDATPPRVKEDNRPIDRAARSGVSYAPALKRVSPSVVTVLSTRTVTMRNRSNPFHDDPFLRQFFGDDGRDSRPRTWQDRALGSGVIVSEDGYILTNSHVVDSADADGVKVTMGNDKTEYAAKVIGSDPQTDIAVLKIEAKNLAPITLGDSDHLEVGDVVLAIGNPFGVGQSVSMGIVSALGRSFGILGRGGYEDFIQTDAPINMGNSGGALVDSDGRLIGINQSIMSGSGANAGVGFAVPINLARSVLDRIVTDGKVRRGQLGVGIDSVNDDMKADLKLPDTSGAIVTGILRNSAAAKAGLKPYDVITAVNGKKVSDHLHLRFAIAQLRPKSKVTLTVIRDSKERMVEVVLDESSTSVASASGGQESNESSVANPDVLKGVTLGELDSRVRRQRKIPDDIKGVLVMEVESKAPASDQLQAGDVIVEVNREAVETVDDVRKLAGEGKGKRVMLRVWTDSDGVGFTRLVFLGGK